MTGRPWRSVSMTHPLLSSPLLYTVSIPYFSKMSADRNTHKCTHTLRDTSQAASHLGSSRPFPRGQYYRHSGPVVPASLHQHHSTIWACPSLLRSPHTNLSLPPKRMSPFVALFQEKRPSFLKLRGTVCRRPYVKEENTVFRLKK